MAFANEIGRLCVARGIDPQAVAELFLADTKLNLSADYLRPGGPFGGSCLPKDLSGMLALADGAGVPVPVLAGVADSNRRHLAWLAQAVRARVAPPGPVLLLGLPSSRAPTTCATARCSTSPACWSRRATSCCCTTPTSTWTASPAPTSPSRSSTVGCSTTG